jgi:hypothetical protein
MDKRVRVSKLELENRAFDRDLSVFEIGGGKRMMGLHRAAREGDQNDGLNRQLQ